jgi:hypothetical protein
MCVAYHQYNTGARGFRENFSTGDRTLKRPAARTRGSVWFWCEQGIGFFISSIIPSGKQELQSLRSLLSQAGQMVNLRMEGGKEKRTDRETA